MIGVVMQDDQLFAGSIGDNISFFADQPDFARIEQCAKQAAVHKDVLAMPMGYNTLIGDMGTVLSGGQKQRVLKPKGRYTIRVAQRHGVAVIEDTSEQGLVDFL